MEITCPQCGTRDARVSEPRTFQQRIRQWFGQYQLRCKRCDTRFQGAIFKPSLVKYARCPKCFRNELSTWSLQYYNPPSWTMFKLRLGGTPYRCEFCRCNFASFRACKERFLWRKHRAPRPHVEPHSQRA